MRLRASGSGSNQLDLGYRAEGLGFAYCSRYGAVPASASSVYFNGVYAQT